MVRSSRQNGEYTIGDLSKEFGVSLRTLRFYEEKGLLSPTWIGAERVYSSGDIIRLKIVLLAKRFSFSLAEIKALIDTRVCNVGATDIASLGLSKKEIERQIAILEAQRQTTIDAITELQTSLHKR